MKKVKALVITTLIFIWFFSFYAINVPKVNLPYKISTAEIYFSGGSSSKIITVNANSLNFMLGKKGEAYVISESVSEEEILERLKATKIFVEQTEFGKSVYAYSKEIDYSIILYGRKINVHLHFSSTEDEKIKIGFPLIFGSF